VYVKAQLALGDRHSAGAVVRANTAASVRTIAGELLARRFAGGLIATEILVEQEVSPLKSYYFAVQIRDTGPARFLVFSRGGGRGFAPADAELALALPACKDSLPAIRDALAERGLTGDELATMATFAATLVRCAIRWGFYTLELNPVFQTADGLIVIDAKAETDDYAVMRAPTPSLLADPSEGPREKRARAYQQTDHRGSLRYVQLVSDDEVGTQLLVGTHSVGGGESLVVIDALDSVGVRAANYCDTSGSPSREKVAFAAELVSSQPHIAALFFSTCIANQPLSVTASGLADGLRRTGWKKPTVIRFAGNEEAVALEIMRAWANENDVPIALFGRSDDEWLAAARVADFLGKRSDGLSG
jgi:succinyl-CoA synthetase beta subunit